MGFPQLRMRRLRNHKKVRDLARETHLTPNDLISPIFIVEGSDIREEIPSMPGQFRLPLSHLVEEVKELIELGIPAIYCSEFL